MASFHCHFDLDYLIALSDEYLLSYLKGGTAAEIRTELVIQRAKGLQYFVGGDCDNKNPDGSCAGHFDLGENNGKKDCGKECDQPKFQPPDAE